MTKPEKLDAFVDQLKTRSDVLAVILFGSYARGDSRPDSDMDLVVILSVGYKRGVEYYEGQAFEIIYTTEQGATDYWRANKHDAAALWEVAQILLDRDGTGERLTQVGESIRAEQPAGLSADQIAHARFDQEDSINAAEAIAPSDPATATLLLYKKVSTLIETYFNLRQKWTPPPKQQLNTIRKQDAPLGELFDLFYNASSTSDRIQIARQLVGKILA